MAGHAPNAPRKVWLSSEDVEAARRLLNLLTSETEEQRSQSTGQSAAIARELMLERAQASIFLRHRRLEVLGKSLSAEPPFDLLVALYVTETRQSAITITKLATLAGLTFTTALRWVDRLVADGWLRRETVKKDARRARITLSRKGRDSLDRLFGWTD